MNEHSSGTRAELHPSAPFSGTQEDQQVPIYLDRASIHVAMLKKHPEIQKSHCYMDSSTQGFACVVDMTGCTEGKECEIARDDESDSYYGLRIRIIRFRDKILGQTTATK